MQNSALKSAIFHTLEALAAVMLASGLDFIVTSVIPNLPVSYQAVGVGVAIPLLSGIAKWLRASTNSVLPDYVNKA